MASHLLRNTHNLGRAVSRQAHRQSTLASAATPRHMTSAERGRGAELLETLAETCSAQAQPLTAAFLQKSLATYLDCTPSAGVTVDALVSQGGVAHHTMAHDHYAYRTLGLPGLGIASLAAVLHELGYTLEEEGMLFPAKKLTASWFAHRPGMHGNGGGQAHPMPRIFVSEVKVGELSPASQVIIRKYVDGMRLGPGQVAVACACGQVPWGRIERHEYDTLLKESDYAAWVMVHGYALNHTALAVHRMRTTGGQGLRLQDAARMTAAHGLTMNDDGGVIKVSGDGLLRQCSSMSDTVPGGFMDSSGQVPGSYLELVERAPLPQFAAMQDVDLEEWHRRDGFEIRNAAHLFTSTRA